MTMKGLSPTLAGGFAAVFAFSVAAVAMAPLSSFADKAEATPIKEVILVAKNHLDVGFTCTVPELMRRIRTTDLESILKLLDADSAKPEGQRVRWMLPAWSMDVALSGEYSPERRVRLEEAVRTRRLQYQAMPFTIETEASDLEEMVRLFSYSSAISRRFGIDIPRHAKQSDVPEQGWALATVLANAGVKFLHLGVNRGCKQNADLAKIPRLCWWEGPDGSRILLGFCPNYGEVRDSPIFRVPEGWKHKTYLAYYMRGDNRGPITPKDAEKLVENVRKAIPGVKVRFGDPSEFADAIIAEEKENPTLPVIRGDMPDTWIHGLMSAPEETAIHRHAQTELITLGILDTTLRAFGLDTKPVAKTLDRAYRKSGLYSEHTWGLSCQRERKRFHDPDWRERYERGDFKHIDAALEYHREYARDAHRMAQDGIRERMEMLAKSVDAEGPRVVVFNPLPHARDAVVEVEIPDGGKMTFLARGVPAGGYKTFPVENGKCCQCENVASSNVASSQSHRSNQLALETGIGNISTLATLHTRHFTVKFDLEKGGIASLIENATGRELVKQGGHALGQFLHERFSRTEVRHFVDVYNRDKFQRSENSDCGKGGMPGTNKITYAAMTPKNWTARHVRTALGDEVTLTACDTLGLAKGYELRFSFPDHEAYVDISWKVTDKTPDPTPEGGWICLPFNVAKPSFRVGRIGGTIDPAKDIIFYANRNLVCVDRAITVRTGERGAGVGVASADLPLWSLGKPGLWCYEPDYVPTEPEVFANLYNNQWNTNYPFWIPGTWTATLRVYPVADGADEEQAVFTPAWEIRQPCVAAYADKDNSNRVEHVERVENLHDLHVLHGSKSKGGIAVSRKGVRVTAFCPNPDGRGTVLRVWEQAGNGGEITITLPKGMKATEARPVNLRGEGAGEPIAVKDGTFSFELGAWSPKSFVLIGGAEEACGAAEFFVATNGCDGADGSAARPWRTIQRAADVAVSGDTVTIRGGVYREWVKPANAGRADAPITYQAAKGERVVVTGADPVRGWTRRPDGLWEAKVRYDSFRGMNPFTDNIFGDWFDPRGGYHLRSWVIQNGKALTTHSVRHFWDQNAHGRPVVNVEAIFVGSRKMPGCGQKREGQTHVCSGHVFINNILAHDPHFPKELFPSRFEDNWMIPPECWKGNETTGECEIVPPAGSKRPDFKPVDAKRLGKPVFVDQAFPSPTLGIP